MKRLFIFLGLIILSTILVACTEDETVVTPPSFVGFTIDGSTPITEGDLVRFYKAKNEGIEVTINLSNPDNALITSIIINGKNYRSTRFTDDSTNGTITFTMDAGMTLEQTIYSIDVIEYQDGDKIKGVDVTSSNEFAIYVYKSEPTIERDSYTLFRDSISVNVTINDPDDVIMFSSLTAELFSGETFIKEIELQPSDTNITFDGLLSDKEYDLEISASYNLDDNNGLREEVLLYEDVFTTLENFDPTASIENVEVTSNQIQFDVPFEDEDNVTIQAGLSAAIFNGDTLVEEINLTGTTQGVLFDDLLNDNEYTIEVLADFDLRDGFGVRDDNVLASYTFDTLPQEVPVPDISNVELSNSRVRFDLVIDDLYEIIDFDTLTADLVIGEDIVRASDISIINPGTSEMYFDVDFQVYNLFSNFEFDVVIRASYDLNNGEGVQADQIISEQTFSTVANNEPEVVVSDVIVTQGYVTLNLGVNDPDSTLTGTLEAILYENGSNVASSAFNADDTVVVIPYLVYFEDDYRIEIIANYDLRDQNGIQANQMLFNSFMTSLERKIPAAEFHNVSVSEDEIELDVVLLDADNTIVSGTPFVQLYKDGTPEQSLPLTTGTNNIVFSGLLSNNEYTVQVIADYDLDEVDAGLAPFTEQVLNSTSLLTLEKTVPTVNIIEQTTTTESIMFSVEIIDDDNVIVENSPIAVLMYNNSPTGDTLALQPGNNIDMEFDGLLSNNSYEVVLYTDYNLNDGNSDIEDYEFITLNFRTNQKENPSASITEIIATKNTLSIDVEVTDDDSVLTSDMTAELYIDDTPTGDIISLNEGINTNLTFNTVYSDLRYNVRIFASYYLNDGEPSFTDELMDRELITTEAYSEPTAEIYETTSAEEELIFNVLVTDEDSVITTIEAILFEDGTETANAITLNAGENTLLSFDNLLADTAYEIKIIADYDLNLETGALTDEVLASYTDATGPLVAPTVSHSNDIQGQTSYTTDILLIDPDQVVSANRKAVLYKDGTATATEVLLTSGLNSAVDFTGLLSGYEYEVKIFADLDYRDGTPVQINQEIDSFTIETEAKSLPNFTITNQSITDSKITVEFIMTDTDSVLTGTTIKASLWTNSSMVAEKTLLSNSVTFDISNMIADFEFEIRLTSDYDLDDGNPVVVNGTIFSETYKTNALQAPDSTINSVMIKQNQIDVSITVTDTNSVITSRLDAVLYDEDNNVLQTIALDVGDNDIVFNQALTYQEFYTIAVITTYNLLDGKGSHDDVVLVEYTKLIYNKLRPEADVEQIVITTNSIQFDTTILDKDSTFVNNATATIYQDGSIFTTIPLTVGLNDDKTISGLLSNTTYTVVLTLDYDIDNGIGTMTNYILDSYTFTTAAKDLPSATLSNITTTNTTISFDVDVIDDDSTYTANLKAVLYKDGTATGDEITLSVGSNSETFDTLLFDQDYSVKIVVDYDLNDTINSETGYELGSFDATTDSIVTISDIAVTKREAEFDLDITDIHNILTDGTVEIELFDESNTSVGDTFTVDEPDTSLPIQVTLADSLLSGHTYTVKINATYDLGSGNVTSVVEEFTITTEELVVPSITLDSYDIDNGTSFDVDITIAEDVDSIIQSGFLAVLYQNGLQVASQAVSEGATTNVSFAGYDASDGNDYVVQIEANLDLNDGNGTVSFILDSFVFVYD